MIIVRSPLRITLGGGGTDLPSYYRHQNGFLIAAAIGKQDQYIAAFGGVTCFKFNRNDSVEAWPLNIDQETLYNLEDNLLLFFTGYSRSAASILKEQDDKTKQKNSDMIANLDYVKDLAQRSLSALEGGRLIEFGKLMHEHWDN